MALVVKDRVQETSTTTGTGTLTLSGAATGYQSFSSAIGNGNTTYYAISSGTDWEVGVGTVGSGTLSRDTVLESSNAGSLVDFSAGVKTVFCTYPAERSVNTQDIGVSIQAYDADTAKYDDATANFTGTLQNGGSNVLVDTDIGSTVQAYDADTAKYDDATANFTGTLQNGGSNVVVDTDIGSTVQGYDADTAKYDAATANFTGTLQNGGSNVVVDTDIGSTVQAYDADTTKNDVANTFTANQVISVTDNTNAALRITQTGTGNALVVEDSASPDSSPFVINADGNVGVGTATPTSKLEISGAGAGADLFQTNSSASAATSPLLAQRRNRSLGLVNSGDSVGKYAAYGFDGTNYIEATSITSFVDGTPGTNDMPGRLVFSTTADGSATPVERMRIRSDGNIAMGGVGNAESTLVLQKNLTGATNTQAVQLLSIAQSDVTSAAWGFRSRVVTAASSFTLPNLYHVEANPTTFGAGSTVTNQFGFHAASSLTGATNNYGFYSNIAAATGRWNFYANGTAQNYFAGNVGIGTTSPTEKLHIAGNFRIGDAVLASPSGTAPLYACRSWVNFDGTSNATNLTGTYSQTGTTVTVTITAHGYITGNSAFLDFTSGTAVDGAYTVTVTDANTFTVTQASRTTSGNVTDRRSNIRGSGNVSSVADNGTGDYSVNFITAMPDANYSISAMQSFNLTGAPNTGYGSTAYAVNTTSCRLSVWGSISGNRLDVESCSVQIFR